MKKILSLLLLLVLVSSTVGTYSLAEETNDLTYGKILKEIGIIKGDGLGNLNEDKQLTRGEMVAIISTLTTPKTDTFKVPVKPSFTDVPVNHWAFNHVERAKQGNVTQGIGNGKFGINDKVTYKQSLAFMLNMLGYKTSWDNVSQAAIELGIYSLKGEDSFGDPSILFTRGMMFEVLVNALTALDSNGLVFIDSVMENSKLGITVAQREYLFSAKNSLSNTPYYEGDFSEFGLDESSTLEYVDMSTLNLDPLVPILTSDMQFEVGLEDAYTYIGHVTDRVFEPANFSDFYNVYISSYPVSISKTSRFSIYDRGTDQNVEMLLTLKEDGTGLLGAKGEFHPFPDWNLKLESIHKVKSTTNSNLSNEIYILNFKNLTATDGNIRVVYYQDVLTEYMFGILFQSNFTVNIY